LPADSWNFVNFLKAFWEVEERKRAYRVEEIDGCGHEKADGHEYQVEFPAIGVSFKAISENQQSGT
jgi:hypothetical protein